MKRHAAIYRVLATAVVVALLAGNGWLGLGPGAAACPFCNAISKTLSEEIAGSDHVVFARRLAGTDVPVGETSNLTEPTASGQQPSDAGSARQAQHTAQFEIVEVLKSRGGVEPGKQIELLYFGRHAEDVLFVVYGMGDEPISWSTPVALTPRSVDYIKRLPQLPASGPDRLAFFQQYLEDDEAMLAADAYDEFARAPYADVRALKDRMNRQQLLAWIRSPEISVSHRRLYLTMLGVCGQPEDADALEQLIRTDDRAVRSCLDALVAAYLNLKGEPGLPLVEEMFLANPESEYTDTYSTIMSLRFHLQEGQQIPKERLLAALRRVLDRKDLADLVIPDLARWQDWSVIDRLVTLFKEADQKTSWVRVPVVNYLRACPLPEAKERLQELAQIDPDAVRRAQQFFPLGAAEQRPAAGQASASGQAGTAGAETAGQDSGQPSAGAQPASGGAAAAGADVASATGSQPANAPEENVQAGEADAAPAARTESDSQAAGQQKAEKTPVKQKREAAAGGSSTGRAAPTAARPNGATEQAGGQPKPTWVVLGTAVGVGLVLVLLFVAILYGSWGRTQ